MWAGSGQCPGIGESDPRAYAETIRLKDAELERLKALLARAAEELEEYLPLVHQTWNAKASARTKFIAQLREAAE